jgi:hypothetical protein
MSQAPWLFRQRDISRVFRATRAAGVTARVDIAPDGTISIFELTPQEAAAAPKPAPETNEWDDVLGKPAPSPHQ